MLHIGILGAGRIAVTMAQTIRKMNEKGEDVCLYAVAAREEARAQAFAQAHGVEKAYGSYEAMLADPAVELVYIATPHSHHYEHAMLCLSHGKHVLCEKAFTVNARQAQEVTRYARERGLLITEAIWTRYQPMREALADVLDSGIIGQPELLTANLCYAVTDKERIVQPELAGGALLDVGVYTLNFAEMVFGRAQGVQASCVKSPQGVDISDSITLTWPDGKMAVLTAGTRTVSDRFGAIYGTKGYLMVENINNPQAIWIYDAKHQLVSETPCPPQLTGYEYEVREAAACIRAGKTECPSMPHEETVHMMELMDHIRAQMGLHYPCE